LKFEVAGRQSRCRGTIAAEQEDCMTAYRMIATDGNHRMIDGAAIDRFAAGLRGALLADGRSSAGS
jgi:hypothetical protein